MAAITRIFFIYGALLLLIGSASARHSNDFFYKEVIINAPISEVDAAIGDYDSYHKYFYHMTYSRVIREHSDNSSSCRFEIKVFGRVFWALARMDRIYMNSSLIVYKETTIDTNLKQLDGEWNLIKINDKQTMLVLRGTALPYMLLPESFIKDLLNKEVSAAVGRINRLLERPI